MDDAGRTAETDPTRYLVPGASADAWAKVRPWLERALEAEPDECARLIADLAGDDPALACEVESFLGALAESAQRFDVQGPEVALAALTVDGDDAAPAEAARVGDVIGMYRLVRLVSSGGMGAVYVAERVEGRFRQQVALKLMHPSPRARALADLFNRERQILAGLTHPHIARLYDGGETADGLPFYTMEYVEGVNLLDWCRDHAHDVRSRVRILMDVADALAHAHGHLVVHRDIKPSNILVDAHGRAKLLDFGIADVLDQALHSDGRGLMTPEYAAPEQFLLEPASVATDVYQFGALCYQVLSGALPHRIPAQRTLVAWREARLTDAPAPLRSAFAAAGGAGFGAGANLRRVRRDLDADLDAIVQTCLSKVPEQRYRSMEACIADLARRLERRPVRARRAGPLLRALRFVQRNTLVVAALVVALTAVLAATVLVALRNQELRRQYLRATQQAEQSEALSSFLVGLFRVADPSSNRGATLTANDILSRGTRRIREDLSEQPRERARLLTAIGVVYSNLGDYERARDVFEDAAEAWRDAGPGRDVDAARTVAQLAYVEYILGRYGAAQAQLDVAERTIDDAAPGADDAHIVVDVYRAAVLRMRGEPRAARALLERTAAKRSTLPRQLVETDLQVTAYLGKTLQDLSPVDADAADAGAALLGRGVALEDWLVGDTDPLSIFMRGTWARGLLVAGQPDAAYALLSDTRTRQLALLGPAHFDIGLTDMALGEALLARGEPLRAAGAFADAERVIAAALGPAHKFRALALAGLGRAALANGQAQAALEYFRAAERGLANDGPGSIDRANLARAMSVAALHLCRRDEAAAYAARAWNVYGTLLPPGARPAPGAVFVEDSGPVDVEDGAQTVLHAERLARRWRAAALPVVPDCAAASR